MSTELALHSNDRIIFTMFLAAALHAALILGVTFSHEKRHSTAPTLNITLATHKSKVSPEKADFLAQYNQEASGSEKEAKELSTTTRAEFTDVNINEVNPLPESKSRQQRENMTQLITTQAKTELLSESDDSEDQTEPDEESEGKLDQEAIHSTEYKSLRAKLDNLQQTLAKEPRIRRHTSVSSKASVDAAYLHKWATKVERIGNEQFPAEALRKGIIGNLRMSVILKPDGSIDDIEILQSSGHNVLDNAAIQIIEFAAPFAPFPAEIRKDVDLIEIIRTINFDITGLSTSQ